MYVDNVCNKKRKKNYNFLILKWNFFFSSRSLVLPLIKIIEWNRSGKTGWFNWTIFSLLTNHVFLFLCYNWQTLLNHLTLFSFFGTDYCYTMFFGGYTLTLWVVHMRKLKSLGDNVAFMIGNWMFQDVVIDLLTFLKKQDCYSTVDTLNWATNYFLLKVQFNYTQIKSDCFLLSLKIEIIGYHHLMAIFKLLIRIKLGIS